MPSAPPYRALDAADFPRWTFATLDFDYDPTTRSVWMSYKADGAPFYSLQTLTEIAQVRDGLQALFASPLIETYPVAYFIMASNKPGVFNLGGDLATFATSIKAGDDATLRHYAHLCVELVHGLVTAYGLPMVTVAVVGGRALGGGLEAALAMDFLVADETATLFSGHGRGQPFNATVGGRESREIHNIRGPLYWRGNGCRRRGRYRCPRRAVPTGGAGLDERGGGRASCSPPRSGGGAAEGFSALESRADYDH
jgi:hypothetical protein